MGKFLGMHLASILFVCVSMSLVTKAAAQPTEGWYKAHGWLLWLAFGVFFPAGILVSKYGQSSIKYWFNLHYILQLVGLICATIGLGIGLRKFQALPDSLHAKLGLAIGLLIWMQPVIALIRPKKGFLRPYWYVVHWLFGTTAVVLGWYNIFQGLALYVGDWPNAGTLRGLYIAFSVQVALLGFIYLFLERWQHIVSQAQFDSKTRPHADFPASGSTVKPANGVQMV